MRKVLITGCLAALLAVGAIITLQTAGRSSGASPVSATKHLSCLDLTATVTTQGTEPDVSCLTSGGQAQLKVTTQATPAATAAPAPAHTTVRSNGGGSTNVNVNSSSRTQSSSSSTVITEQNSQSTSGQGHTSNTNRSRTNITITNH
jgi:hypothetical protein